MWLYKWCRVLCGEQHQYSFNYGSLHIAVFHCLALNDWWSFPAQWHLHFLKPGVSHRTSAGSNLKDITTLSLIIFQFSDCVHEQWGSPGLTANVSYTSLPHEPLKVLVLTWECSEGSGGLPVEQSGGLLKVLDGCTSGLTLSDGRRFSELRPEKRRLSLRPDILTT